MGNVRFMERILPELTLFESRKERKRVLQPAHNGGRLPFWERQSCNVLTFFGLRGWAGSFESGGHRIVFVLCIRRDGRADLAYATGD